MPTAKLSKINASSTGPSTITRRRAKRSLWRIPAGTASGYALLADPDGGAHYLLIPTQTMTGTDSTELLDPNLPNYFAEAWHARDLLSKYVGHAVPGTDVGIAVGTAATRRQHQFHVHIECLRPEVVDSLKAVEGDSDGPMVAGNGGRISLSGNASPITGTRSARTPTSWWRL